MLHQSLGALLISAGHAHEALQHIEKGLDAVEKQSQPNTMVRAWCVVIRRHASCFYTKWPGLLFNKAKLLGHLGRQDESQATYAQALHAARTTRAASTWLKACAALSSPTTQQVDDMKAAAAHLGGPSQRGARSKRRGQTSKEQWGWLDGAPGPDQSFLHFALYKVYDNAGYVSYDACAGCDVDTVLQGHATGLAPPGRCQRPASQRGGLPGIHRGTPRTCWCGDHWGQLIR